MLLAANCLGVSAINTVFSSSVLSGQLFEIVLKFREKNIDKHFSALFEFRADLQDYFTANCFINHGRKKINWVGTQCCALNLCC